MDGAVKYSLEKPKHIILLYFRALFLDLLRFPYLAEGHQEPKLHPLPFNQNANRFFWVVICTSHVRKLCPGAAHVHVHSVPFRRQEVTSRS